MRAHEVWLDSAPYQQDIMLLSLLTGCAPIRAGCAETRLKCGTQAPSRTRLRANPGPGRLRLRPDPAFLRPGDPAAR